MVAQSAGCLEFPVLGENRLPPHAETHAEEGDGVLSEESFPVFVVDDDDSMRKALKRPLNANGYRGMTFASAEDFFLDGVVRRVGCVILEIQLPGMSGLDLHGNLASSESNCPLIFITAHDNPQWQEKAPELGAAAYLRKPFDQQSLLDAVQATCSKKEPRV